MTIQTQAVGELEYLTFGDNTDPGGWGNLMFGDNTDPGGGGVGVLTHILGGPMLNKP